MCMCLNTILLFVLHYLKYVQFNNYYYSQFKKSQT